MVGSHHSGDGEEPRETAQGAERHSSNQDHSTDHQHHTQVHTCMDTPYVEEGLGVSVLVFVNEAVGSCLLSLFTVYTATSYANALYTMHVLIVL